MKYLTAAVQDPIQSYMHQGLKQVPWYAPHQTFLISIFFFVLRKVGTSPFYEGHSWPEYFYNVQQYSRSMNSLRGFIFYPSIGFFHIYKNTKRNRFRNRKFRYTLYRVFRYLSPPLARRNYRVDPYNWYIIGKGIYSRLCFEIFVTLCYVLVSQHTVFLKPYLPLVKPDFFPAEVKMFSMTVTVSVIQLRWKEMCFKAEW